MISSILEGQLREISTYNIDKVLPFAQAHIWGLSSIPLSLSYPTSHLLSINPVAIASKCIQKEGKHRVSSRKRNQEKKRLIYTYVGKV